MPLHTRIHALLLGLLTLVAAACSSSSASRDPIQTGNPSDGLVVQPVNVPTTGGLPEPRVLRVVSWNIRHGLGEDDRLDLARIAARLQELQPDLVFLQEVDRLTARSGHVDQPAWLGQELGMWSAFGAFMPLDGGDYGLCILSRWPVLDVRNVKLPPGRHEPRTTLAATVAIEPGVSVRLYDVHLDWLKDDGNRYAQARALLSTVSGDVARMGTVPAIIAGDFNDEPGSRTIQLLRDNFSEATKTVTTPGPGESAHLDGPGADATTYTWPAANPTREIDFVFVLPGSVLTSGPAYSVSAEGASDHRPVFATISVR